MKFQKCKCSYKLIEIEINWVSLGAIELYQLSAALRYLHKGLHVVPRPCTCGEALWALRSAPDGGWVLSFSQHAWDGQLEGRGCSPSSTRLQRRGRFLSRAEPAMTDPWGWARRGTWRSCTTKLFLVFSKRSTAPCLKVTEEDLFVIVRCSRIAWYGRYGLTC